MSKKVFCVFAILAAILCSSSFAQNTSFYNVRGDVATSQQINPVRWNVDATWVSTDQLIHDNSCVIYLNTFGTTVPNGDVMFPWDYYFQVRNSFGALVYVNAAEWCRTLPEGTRICIDGVTLSQPDRYGLKTIVTAAHACN